MRSNETALTPIYRYIMSVIEDNGLDHPDASYEIIRKSDQKVQADTIVNFTLELIKCYCGNKQENVLAVWNKLYDVIKQESCTECFLCRKCKCYFWEELGELFCGRENEEKKKGVYFPVRKLPEQMEKCFEPSDSISNLYLSHIKRQKNKNDDFFLILKGMSSSTPSILNSIYDTEEYSGGGFYFKYHGYGVAVDPGYHFIHNLHHYGLSVLDIDAVIITHEHIDHNNDMRLLDDLHFAVYKDWKPDRSHTITWILDKVSYQIAKVYQENETGFNTRANDLYYVDTVRGQIKNDDTTITMPSLTNGNLDINFFKTRHIQRGADKSFKPHTFGCKFFLGSKEKQSTVVYTSDTSFYPELIEEIGICDVLILNISGIYEDDFMLIKAKERHLGYYGSFHLVKGCFEKYKVYPRLVLLSEFWNGKNDIRYDAACQLSRDFRKAGIHDMKVVPADVGMEFDLTDRKMRCSQCGKMADAFIIQRPSDYNEEMKIICKECYY